MKKLFFASFAMVATLLASCGGQTSSNTDAVDSDTVAPKVFVQKNIEDKIKADIDSIAKELAKHQSASLVANIKDGKVTLNDDEKKVKPDYLLDPSCADNLSTYSQKYRAFVMLSTDKAVAELYGIDVAPYTEAITKIATEIGDPIIKEILESGDDVTDKAETFYQKEEEAGRINFFWEATCAGAVEQLFIMSNNIEKFLPSLDDDAAANITFRIACIQDALQRLAEYAPELEELNEAIKPIEVLNAISVEQLKEQLAEMREPIAQSRANLLK